MLLLLFCCCCLLAIHVHHPCHHQYTYIHSMVIVLDAVDAYAYEFTKSYAYAYILMCVNFDTG
jgi:hypothetical protein